MAFVVTLMLLSSLPLRKLSQLSSTMPPHHPIARRAPIFIIGHWRSGTTYLHNLLTRDPRFCWPSLEYCIAPEGGLHRRIFALAAQTCLPSHRPMDRVPIRLDAPQEEEWLLATRTSLSFNHCFFFPQSSALIFDRLLSPTEAVAIEWSETYHGLLRALACSAPEQTALLKSPGNAGRIPFLLENFPDARFVHIVRNPYEVFSSSVYLWERLLPWWSLQRYPDIDIVSNVLAFYQKLMRKYLSDRRAIAEDKLIEVRYEDLVTDPLGTLEIIYEGLRLTDFSGSKPFFEQFLISQQGYRRNRFQLPEKHRIEVNHAWNFSFKHWNYEPKECP
ncbi:MAG: sulfotransferase [Acidobacteriota bacterium]|nr:MAG: sulfotransferase [Acidobacteriota bacterium]